MLLFAGADLQTYGLEDIKGCVSIGWRNEAGDLPIVLLKYRARDKNETILGSDGTIIYAPRDATPHPSYRTATPPQRARINPWIVSPELQAEPYDSRTLICEYHGPRSPTLFLYVLAYTCAQPVCVSLRLCCVRLDVCVFDVFHFKNMFNMFLFKIGLFK